MEVTRCKRCIMDNSADDTIKFDDIGNCNYCNEAAKRIKEGYFPNNTGQKKLNELLAKIKKAGRGKKYDCIMGISGGLDSSYLAYLASKWDLRILCVHIDDGYDTEISKSNIKKLIERTKYDYTVIRPDAEQYNALTLAYMKAGVPNIAVPQDNILFAYLYSLMKEYKISYFLSGSNLALESIVQNGNTWKNSDVVNIKDIHKKFGTKSIDKLKFYSTLEKQFDKYLFHVHTATPLDYIDYNYEQAFVELNQFCGFEYYGRKHLENALTAFIQLRWFPEKFKVDKRKWHYSSMIMSGQMTREDALNLLREPIFEEELMDEYENLIISKLGISKRELNELIKAPSHQHYEYDNENNHLFFKIYDYIRNVRRRLYRK